MLLSSDLRRVNCFRLVRLFTSADSFQLLRKFISHDRKSSETPPFVYSEYSFHLSRRRFAVLTQGSLSGHVRRFLSDANKIRFALVMVRTFFPSHRNLSTPARTRNRNDRQTDWSDHSHTGTADTRCQSWDPGGTTSPTISQQTVPGDLILLKRKIKYN